MTEQTVTRTRLRLVLDATTRHWHRYRPVDAEGVQVLAGWSRVYVARGSLGKDTPRRLSILVDDDEGR
jgi:hypothetical protein